MTEKSAGRRWLGLLAPVLLLASVVVAFWNTPGNVFELDDWHSITNNPAVRTTANIPKFFTDASTSSILKPNQDYRPVLLTTYAINHAMSGYNEDPTATDWWHWTNMLIHFGVAWCLFLVGRRLFGSLGLAPIKGLKVRVADAACLGAAFLFAIHPVATGPVNYISARSSTLTALFVLLATLFYLRGLARPKRWWRFAVSAGFFALGMFTKVEAVSFVALAVMAELLLNPAVRDRPLWRRPLQKGMYLRLAPMLAIAAAVLTIWYFQTGLRTSETRAGLGVTPKDYLVTQFRAWWYYIGQVFAPFNLIADYPSYPLSRWENFFALKDSGFLAFKDARAVYAFLAWGLIAGVAFLMARRLPAVTFLVGGFFICLAPHSSIVPLAEPVNEHRPYLPHVCVFLLMAIGLALVTGAAVRRPRLMLACIAAVLAVPLIGITRERNAVWKDGVSLWGDAAAKAPDSARVQMNYGVALMRTGRSQEAERRFRETIRLAPGYHYAYSNLGIALAGRGELAEAQAAHDAAVRLAPGMDGPRLWRARFYAGLRNIPAAAADFVEGVRLNGADLRLVAGAAETLSRLGRSAEAESYVKRGQELDPSPGHVRFEAERREIQALMGPADANAQAARGAEFRSQGKWLEAEWCYREAVRLDPENVVAHVNLGIILAAQGQDDVAAKWYDRAVELQPLAEMPVYWRGRFRASRGNLDGAMADFIAARRHAGAGRTMRHEAAVIEVMLKQGHREQAEALVAGVDPVSRAELERERADFRSQVLRAR